MDKLFPIVRRVRRPLLPPDDEPGTCVPANALRASDAENQSGTREDARPPEAEKTKAISPVFEE